MDDNMFFDSKISLESRLDTLMKLKRENEAQGISYNKKFEEVAEMLLSNDRPIGIGSLDDSGRDTIVQLCELLDVDYVLENDEDEETVRRRQRSTNGLLQRTIGMYRDGGIQIIVDADEIDKTAYYGIQQLTMQSTTRIDDFVFERNPSFKVVFLYSKKKRLTDNGGRIINTEYDFQELKKEPVKQKVKNSR